MKTSKPGTGTQGTPVLSPQLVKIFSARGIRIKESVIRLAAGLTACLLLGLSGVKAQDPVLAFKAHFTGEKIRLYWTVAPGTSYNYFAIERSWNGKQFETVGLVAAEGTASTLDTRSFTDKDYYSTIVYYRLRLVGQDLQSAVVGNIVALQLSEDAREFRISPFRDMPGAVYIDGKKLEADEIIVDAVNREKQIIANGILKKHKGEMAFIMQDVRKLKPGPYVVSAFFNHKVHKTLLVIIEPPAGSAAEEGPDLTSR